MWGTEVTTSRFFSWEITFWQWSPYWTILLKIYRFRKRLQGRVEAGEAFFFSVSVCLRACMCACGVVWWVEWMCGEGVDG